MDGQPLNTAGLASFHNQYFTSKVVLCKQWQAQVASLSTPLSEKLCLTVSDNRQQVHTITSTQHHYYNTSCKPIHKRVDELCTRNSLCW